MEKNIARNVLFSFLLIVSIFSYVFLHSISTAATGETFTEVEEQETVENVGTALPDVELMKKVFESGKRFIPASN